jgi:hypothetical protein
VKRRHGLAGLLAWLLLAPAAAADEGWIIERLRIALEIRPDGTLAALEAIDVDFRGLSRHGIFRDMAYVFDYDATQLREYEIDLASVTSAEGRRHQVQSSTAGATRRFRIGDPNRTISGKETYRLAYHVRGALNGFPDHDELYWNATGTWPVRIATASVVVKAPAGAIDRVDCFQGPRGSTEHCAARFAEDEASYTATRPLVEGEQMTIVAGLRKGAVADPVPKLVARLRGMGGASGALGATAPFFEPAPRFVALMAVGFAAALSGVGWLWWRIGRDRQYVALYQTGRDAGPDEAVPLGGARPIAVEFQPPDGIRPGQMGLLVDERADTLDVTATIIDLAVRGYLTITELPKSGWFSAKDWQLDRVKDAGPLLEYERLVLNGLFDAGQSRKLSELKNKFYDDLSKAKTALYRDAVDRKWFPRNPESVRTIFRVAGIFGILAGVALTLLLGAKWGAGLVGLPVVAGGLALAIAARGMPRRTAAGRDLMRRTLGFARYIRTAETHQQAFAERANLFTEYLPYAIAFKCVDGWARAFKDIDLQEATARWYSGTTPFTTGSFASSLGSFSSSVSTAIASTPGGSGSSGFSGGSSGGGGGGGGGGSW